MPTSSSHSRKTTIPLPITSLRCGRDLPRDFPGVTFYFLPSDIVTQILNFGLPSPIDVQFERRTCRQAKDRRHDAGAVAPCSGPGRPAHPAAGRLSRLNVNVDRTKAAQGGYSLRDVGSSLQNLLSGSSQLTPMFFLNYKNGVNYNIVAAGAAV